MNGCTVNIAEFRCRAIKSRAIRPSFRSGVNPSALRLSGTIAEKDMMMLQEAVLHENPTVYDIGLAREAQRTRHRAVFQPISVQRRAKVIRFNNDEPLRMVLRAEEGRERWLGAVDGSHDLPPAA